MDINDSKEIGEPTPLYHLRTFDEASWRKHCQLVPFQGSGAGGQKRNRVYSGARWVHPCGLQGESAEHREVKFNTRTALQALRTEVAFHYYREFEVQYPPNLSAYKGRIDQNNWDYPLFVVFSLASLYRKEGHLSGVSLLLGWTTSSLTRQWGRDKRVWTEVQKIRDEFGQKRLSL